MITRNSLQEENILTLCNMSMDIFYAIRGEAELRLKEYFRFSKQKEIKIQNPVLCSFWNRGFDMEVNRIFYENGNVFLGGKTFNGKEDSEFFNYIFSNFNLQQLFKEISKHITL